MKSAEADRLLDIPAPPRDDDDGGGGGATACQAAVKSCEGVEDGIICMLFLLSLIEKEDKKKRLKLMKKGERPGSSKKMESPVFVC